MTTSRRIDEVELTAGESGPSRLVNIQTTDYENGEQEKAFVRMGPPNPSRHVCLVSSEGSFWGRSRRGSPMTQNGHIVGPWPEIRDAVEANRHWAVMVIPDDESGGPPTMQDMLHRAVLFDCPREQFLTRDASIRNHNIMSLPLVDKFEAIQDLGYTRLSNNEIHAVVENLDSVWGGLHPLLWHSTQFSLRAAILILTNTSFDRNRDTLRVLWSQLDFKSERADSIHTVYKHIGCMAGFFVCGSLTFGAGVLAFWATAGVSMEHDRWTANTANAQILEVQQRFDRLRALWDDDHDTTFT